MTRHVVSSRLARRVATYEYSASLHSGRPPKSSQLLPSLEGYPPIGSTSALSPTIPGTPVDS